MSEIKLCDDCAYHERLHKCDNVCLYDWPNYVGEGQRRTICNHARWLESLCGAEARKFEPRKIPFADWKKAHANQYVTLAEWVTAGGNEKEFKDAFNRSIGAESAPQLRHHDGFWATCTGPCGLYGSPDGYRILLDADGELQQRDWRKDIPWHLAPWAKWFACDNNGHQYFYGFKPVSASECFTTDYRGDTWMHLGEAYRVSVETKWFESITPRPEGK